MGQLKEDQATPILSETVVAANEVITEGNVTPEAPATEQELNGI